MILRIVKMEVDPQKLEIFNHFMKNLNEEKVKLEGCVHHDHFPEKKFVNVYYSYTIWENVNYLKKYKKSPLFKEVVKTLKSLCMTEPYAWTVENIIEQKSGNEE